MVSRVPGVHEHREQSHRAVVALLAPGKGPGHLDRALGRSGDVDDHDGVDFTRFQEQGHGVLELGRPAGSDEVHGIPGRGLGREQGGDLGSQTR